MFAKTML